jgi:hypothetical protein
MASLLVQPLMVLSGQHCGCDTQHFSENRIVILISERVNPNSKVSSNLVHYCLTVVFVLGQKLGYETIQALTLGGRVFHPSQKVSIMMYFSSYRSCKFRKAPLATIPFEQTFLSKHKMGGLS